MITRKAEKEDVPAIVDLLRVSLGESLMPKSEDFWNWKHNLNPFGVSPVLVAVDQEKIVGVRAFMRWDWSRRGDLLRAVRAVDTATHPDYQGKGIFKTLTLALLDQCRQDGIHLVYNTPNSKSMPGYLKMGWERHGRMPLKVRPHWPVKSEFDPAMKAYALERVLGDPALQGLLEEHQRSSDFLSTRYSVEYLRWRYQLNPNIRYYAACQFSGTGSFFYVFRMKQSRVGTEFRICECMGSGKDVNSGLTDSLLNAANAAGARVITMAGGHSGMPLRGIAFPFGPKITVLKLRPFPLSLTLNQWSPSLGDMEIF